MIKYDYFQRLNVYNKACFLMIEEYKYSLPVCQSFVDQCLMEKVYRSIPLNTKAIAAYSLHKSTALADSIFLQQEYCPDQPKSRFSQDQTEQFANKKNIRVSLPRKESKYKTESRASKQDKPKEETSQIVSSFGNAKLTPLQTFQDQNHSEDESQDLQTRLRERKIHQQYFRTRYEQNVKQGVKKKKQGIGKNEGKGHSIVAYDFDGGIIQSNGPKQEGIKLPLHYLDLEVHVVEKEQIRDLKKKASRGKQQPKQQNIKKQEIKIAESHFLKDFNSILWANGVQLKQSKQQCRKILGYQNSNLLKKRKIDLFKQTDSPIHIKFSDLASYKKLASATSQSYLTHQNLNSRETQKSILSRHSNYYNSESKSKNITITNNRALQFLIDEDSQMRKVGFAKKGAKSIHFHN